MTYESGRVRWRDRTKRKEADVSMARGLTSRRLMTGPFPSKNRKPLSHRKGSPQESAMNFVISRTSHCEWMHVDFKK